MMLVGAAPPWSSVAGRGHGGVQWGHSGGGRRRVRFVSDRLNTQAAVQPLRERSRTRGIHTKCAS